MIDFTSYTRAAIQKEMLSQVPAEIDTREGSMIQTAVGPMAWYLEGFYMLLSQVQENAYAGTAVGEFLDYICAERGIVRKEAVAAIRRGTFDAPIPEGATFKTINGARSVIFRAGELLSAKDGIYEYRMTCTTEGAIGNAYTGPILPITAVSGLTFASIGEILTAGSEEESDASLRARYFASFEATVFGGNIASYRSAIMAIEGVGAVQVYPIWDGGGTVLCSILDSRQKPASADLIAAVQEIICPAEEGETASSANGYGLAPIGASVTITTAQPLLLAISCRVQLASGLEGNYQRQIEEAIEVYLEKVRSSWGNPLKSHKVEYQVSVYVSQVMGAILSVENVVNVREVTINGSSEDLMLTETARLQQIPELGEVKIHVG